MNELDMSKLVKLADGFARDENGKIWALPMKFPECLQAEVPTSGTKNGEKRSCIRRKYIPIEPFQLNPAALEEPQNPSKKPKFDRPIRKELFKVPQKKSEKTNSRRSSLRNIPTLKKPISTSNKKKTAGVKRQISYNDGSPLFNIDEAEQILFKESQIMKPIKTVLFPMDSIQEESNQNVGYSPEKCLSNKTGELKDSEEEYLELERQFASAKKSAKKNNTMSPLTSVCTLLENTKIGASGQKKDNKEPNQIVSDILALVQENKEHITLFKHEYELQIQSITEKFNACIEQCQIRHKKILELLPELSTENKENNSNRRSNRVKTPTFKAKFGSPGISKKVDLRKTTLNKNLSRNLQNESPRTRNAVNMYNAVRNDCDILCTPKLDRSEIDQPQNSPTRSLSRRIQKQCFLLQGTPKVSF